MPSATRFQVIPSWVCTESRQIGALFASAWSRSVEAASQPRAGCQPVARLGPRCAARHRPRVSGIVGTGRARGSSGKYTVAENVAGTCLDGLVRVGKAPRSFQKEQTLIKPHQRYTIMSPLL
jgi:hypothetical protein